jgi:hypothetical protein
MLPTELDLLINLRYLDLANMMSLEDSILSQLSHFSRLSMLQISNSLTEEIFLLSIYSHSFLQIWNLYFWEVAILKNRYQMNYRLFIVSQALKLLN